MVLAVHGVKSVEAIQMGEAGNLDDYRVHRGELEPGIQAVKEVRAVLYSSPHAAPILE